MVLFFGKSHLQTDCFVVSLLFSVARHARFSKLGSKPGWIICLPLILLHCHEETSERFETHMYHFYFLFKYISASRLHSKSLALQEWQPLIPSQENSTLTGVGKHILSSTERASSLYHTHTLSLCHAHAQIFTLFTFQVISIESGKHFHATYGTLNSCFDHIGLISSAYRDLHY